MKPTSTGPSFAGKPKRNPRPEEQPAAEEKSPLKDEGSTSEPPGPPGEPTLEPGSPTLRPEPEKIKICAYWNPSATPGYPWIVKRDHFGNGCFDTSGQGWLQHIREVMLPWMSSYDAAGWDVYTDLRNPMGRGDGDPENEHMDALQIWSAPGWMVLGFREALQILNKLFPGKVIVYMGNLTGTETNDGNGLSDQMFADLGPEKWAKQVMYAWSDIIGAKCHIAVDTLYARNHPSDGMMEPLMQVLRPALQSYGGRVLGEPFNERGTWTKVASTADGQETLGTYVAFNYWRRMSQHQRDRNGINPTFVGDFGDTDGSFEQVAQFIADRHKEGVVANISGSTLDKMDPRKLFDAVMKRLG